jgi:HK97 family phage portal protein
MDSRLGGGRSISGSDVTPESAMAFAAFFSGVLQISQTIASCDFRLYRRKPGGGKEDWRKHPLYRVLYQKANPRTNSFIWKEVSQHHLIVWGNSYSYKQTDGAGRVVALWLMDPSG